MNSNPGAEDQVLEHTPGQTAMIEGVYGAIILSIGNKHVAQIADDYNDYSRTPEDAANRELLLMVLTAPHRCNVPDCPGPKNMARLNAAAALAEAAEEADTCMGELRPSFLVMGRLAHDNLKAALAAYRALEQPETAGGNQ